MTTFAIVLVLVSTFLHAGWNLLVGAQRTGYTMLRVVVVIAVVGIVPALIAEYLGPTLLPKVWGYVILTGISLAIYYLGLAKGYQSGHFTVVYPVARALPILLVAIADLFRGNAPSVIAWLGMGLVSVGCMVMPQKSLKNFSLSDYWNPAMFWIVVTATGTVGYSVIDHAAADLLPPGPAAAARYGIFEFVSAAVFYWLILKMLREPTGQFGDLSGWKVPALGAAGLFGAYWLILWSYQLSPQASYVVALRQFSIVIGVMMGALVFKEPAPFLRITASLGIAVGIALITLGG
jgi:uncharacterized membrane protein